MELIRGIRRAGASGWSSIIETVFRVRKQPILALRVYIHLQEMAVELLFVYCCCRSQGFSDAILHRRKERATQGRFWLVGSIPVWIVLSSKYTNLAENVLCLEIVRQTRLLISIGWYATQTCLFLRMSGFTPLNSHPHQAMRITFNKTLRFIQARQNSIWTNYWVLCTMALNSVNAYNLAAFTEFQAV